jgi:hypothetical protein
MKFADINCQKESGGASPIEGLAVVQGGLVGPWFSAFIAYQKSDCHMSYAMIQTFLTDVFGVSLSCGHLAKVVPKAAAALAEPYDELRQALSRQGRLGIDETGHPEGGEHLWTWCFLAENINRFAARWGAKLLT